MSQIFHRSTNGISRFTLYGAVFVLAGLTWGISVLSRSSYATGRTLILHQPVPFSHDHHTAGLGIDCRYCHTSVETAGFAGIPPTATCMNCHKQIWSDSPMLEPVRESFRQNRPLQWARVHDLPAFVYFNHGIHVAKGIGCETCHGRVDKMPLMQQSASLQMEWCLECHRNPEQFVRPRSEVFTMGYVPSEPQQQLGPRLVREYDIARLTYCSTCHR